MELKVITGPLGSSVMRASSGPVVTVRSNVALASWSSRWETR
jgi:hypothetical protein